MKRYANKVFTPIVLLMLFIFAAIIFLSFRQTAEAKTSAAMVTHSQEVLIQTSKILTLITDNETGSGGFLITGNRVFPEPLGRSKANVYPQIDSFRLLTKDNPSQQARIDSLIYYTKKLFIFSDSTIRLRNEKGLESALQAAAAGKGKLYMDSIRKLTDNMLQEEYRLLEERKITHEKATTILNRTFISIIVVIVVLLFILLRKDYLAIAARKTAEDALKKNETFFQLMTNNVKDYAIFMLDINGVVISWNKGAERVNGYERQDITGKPFDIFYSKADIDNDEPRRNLAMAKKYGQFETDGPRLRKDGTVFWASMVLIALVNDNGNFYGYSAIIHDITERKKTQEQVDFLSVQINQSNDAIYTVDANRKIKSWNHGAENLYGYTKIEVLEKDPNEVLKTGLTAEEINSAVKKIAREDYWTGELQRQTKNGDIIYVHSSTTTIKDNRGNITGYVAVSFDITEQKKLREQANHLARIVEQSSDAIFSRGLDQRLISWNKGAEKLFGYSSEEAIGKTIAALGFIKLTAEETAGIEKQVSESGMWKAEMDYYHKDGSAFFWAITGNLIRNEKGEITSFHFIVNDISRRKQLEEQLKRANEGLEEKVKVRTEEINRSEKKYRYLFENNPMPMWVIDLNTFNFLDVNEMAVLQYGYSREEFLSMTALDIRPEGEKDLFKQSDHSFEINGVNYNRGIWNHRKKDGTIIQVEIIAHQIIFGGTPARFILANNITEKKKAEEKLIQSEKLYRSLFENMLHGFAYCKAIFDEGRLQDYTYTSVNSEYETITGLKDITGKKQSELMPGLLDANPAYAGIITRVALSGKPEKFETYVVLLDKWLSISLYSPEKEYFVILADNITERKQIEQKIKRLNTDLEERVRKRTEQLRKTNEELEAFSYSVSHDLRAPLRAIIGFTAILEEEYSSKLDNEARRITSIIKNNTLKMGHLIDDLLTFSRMGRQDIVKTFINTDEMIKEIIDQPDIKQYNSLHPVKWVIHDLPDISGDINTLRQVWINLISNAVKYSGKADFPKIEIGSWHEQDKIVFFIKDNGVGFDEKYKNKLFRVFQRLHSTDEFEGTGIGLAIVEKIISKHDGKVWADAVVDKGANFYFSLPDESNGITA